MRILILDRDREVSNLVAAIVRREGHEPDIAKSADDLLLRLASASYGALIVDSSPRLRRTSLLSQLSEAMPDMLARTIVTTADAREETLHALAAQRPHCVLVKPYEVGDVLTALRGLREGSGTLVE